LLPFRTASAAKDAEADEEEGRSELHIRKD
jgi:hypothetical protein